MTLPKASLGLSAADLPAVMQSAWHLVCHLLSYVTQGGIVKWC